MRAALCGGENAESTLRRWLEAHEKGDWTAEMAIEKTAGLDHEPLLAAYFSAAQWAEEMLRLAL